MEGYQVAVGALADRMGNQAETLRRALEQRAREDRQAQLAREVGADLLPGTVEF